MNHADTCTCEICRAVRTHAVAVTQADMDALAREWEFWSGERGVVAKLRSGATFNPGSPIWNALQAIARTRIAGEGVTS